MTHEASHCLIFKSKNMNEYFAMLCNIGMGIPAATTFKRYHMEHHLFQGKLSSFYNDNDYDGMHMYAYF